MGKKPVFEFDRMSQTSAVFECSFVGFEQTSYQYNVNVYIGEDLAKNVTVSTSNANATMAVEIIVGPGIISRSGVRKDLNFQLIL